MTVHRCSSPPTSGMCEAKPGVGRPDGIEVSPSSGRSNRSPNLPRVAMAVTPPRTSTVSGSSGQRMRALSCLKKSSVAMVDVPRMIEQTLDSPACLSTTQAASHPSAAWSDPSSTEDTPNKPESWEKIISRATAFWKPCMTGGDMVASMKPMRSTPRMNMTVPTARVSSLAAWLAASGGREARKVPVRMAARASGPTDDCLE
mmetsp:Transcript_4511/g.14623  ORF Transcript_4511/g.14623 Transcript_4511/m.14623 type:complete len:202 (-) Transcript_4511:313-918(-)